MSTLAVRHEHGLQQSFLTIPLFAAVAVVTVGIWLYMLYSEQDLTALASLKTSAKSVLTFHPHISVCQVGHLVHLRRLGVPGR